MLKQILASLELGSLRLPAEHILRCDCKVNIIIELHEKGIHPSNLRHL